MVPPPPPPPPLLLNDAGRRDMIESILILDFLGDLSPDVRNVRRTCEAGEIATTSRVRKPQGQEADRIPIVEEEF